MFQIRYVQALLLLARLYMLKLLLRSKIRQSFDLDRLALEWHMALESIGAKRRMLVVGVHDRSYVYQLVFDCTFVDTESTHLVDFFENCRVDNFISVREDDYDVFVLAGVLGYGTGEVDFRQKVEVLARKNKTVMIFDWKKNLQLHVDALSASSEIKKIMLKRHALIIGSHGQ